MGSQIDFSDLWYALGQKLATKPPGLEGAKIRSIQENPWFTGEHIDFAIQAILNHYLQKENLDEWLLNYPNIQSPAKPKRIGIICAGNIPMVGFHDILCVLTAGHHAVVKLSQKDQFLIPAIISELIELNPSLASRITFVNRLEQYEAIIATGSNNSQRYFKSYFGHVPHIFRHNRSSVGILHHDDDSDTLKAIAADIFIHFGLGCRSISKLFIPSDYNLDDLFVATLNYSKYVIHTKYNNNFIYHTALFQMNKVEYLTNDLLILLETEEWHSPLSIVYYERYVDKADLMKRITPHGDHIQAIYSSHPIVELNTRKPGTGQLPQLGDYADHVDTMKWLISL